MEDQTRIWDLYVPPDQLNHLFYYTTCTMSEYYGSGLGGRACSCDAALGGRHSYDYDTKISNWPFGYPFFTSDVLSLVNETYNVFGGPDYKGKLTSGLQLGAFNLSVQYCLARPFESTCHIGVSPALLLAVVLCFIVKTSIAVLVTIVLGRQNQGSLVTFGDYFASLIEAPAVETSHVSAIGMANLRGRIIFPGRRRWQNSRKRRVSVIPRTVWLITCGLFASAIAVSAFLFSISVPSSGALL
jgi:hypothetical protein